MIVRAHTHTRMVGSGVAMQEQLNNLAMVGQEAPPDLTEDGAGIYYWPRVGVTILVEDSFFFFPSYFLSLTCRV